MSFAAILIERISSNPAEETSQFVGMHEKCLDTHDETCHAENMQEAIESIGNINLPVFYTDFEVENVKLGNVS